MVHGIVGTVCGDHSLVGVSLLAEIGSVLDLIA